MKKGIMAKKGLYAGTGAGLILFVLVGMFPGSLMGGAIGLFISNMIFGTAVEASILPRIITVISMVAGVIGSAAVFVVGSSVLGWSVGAALDVVHETQESTELEMAKEKSSS